MDFNVPTDAIEREYKSIKDSLITHRPEDGYKDWSYRHTIKYNDLIKQIVIRSI